MVTTFVSTIPLPMVEATAVADESAGEIEKRRERDRLARRQDLGRDDGGDRVGGIVKAVDVFERDRREDTTEDEHEHAIALLRIFQRRPAG